MDSFYGGKQGVSFVIKAKFKSYDEMIQCFKNAEDKSVWYGEYCIIDTVNKNDPNNGKVYRRTLNTAGDTSNGFAEYIGQIVGPAGGTPNVELGSLANTIDTFDDLKPEQGVTPSANEAIYYNNGTEYKDNFSSTPATFTSAAASSIQFKSGKDYYNTVTPTLSVTPALRYNWYNFRKATSENYDGFAPAKIVIGFEIPYVYNEIAAVQELGYFDSLDIEENHVNDFYNQYTLKIPRGIPGAYIDKIRSETAPYTCFDWNNLKYQYDEEHHITNYITGPAHNFGTYTGEIWVCDFNYPTGEEEQEEGSGTGQPHIISITMYLGEKREINNINLADNGALTANYTDTQVSDLGNIKWIDTITVAEDGTLTINYNNDTSDNFPQKLKWIKDIHVKNDGTLIIYYNDNIYNEVNINPQEQGWYELIENNYQLTEDTFIVSGKTYYQLINENVYVEVNINPKNEGYYEYNGENYIKTNDTQITLDKTYYQLTGGNKYEALNRIKWISNIWVDTNVNNNTYGDLKVRYNNTTTDTNIGNLGLIKSITYPGDITQVNKSQSRALTISYSNNQTFSTSEINYIQDVVISTTNHLLILFVATNARTPELNEGTNTDVPSILDNNNIRWWHNINNQWPETEYLKYQDVWYRDFGPIGLDIHSTEFLTGTYGNSETDIKADLENHFGETTNGTIVLVTDTTGGGQNISKSTFWVHNKSDNSSEWINVGDLGNTTEFLKIGLYNGDAPSTGVNSNQIYISYYNKPTTNWVSYYPWS